jgi:regulator of protease activity HflC (stomatin/prohibitin superfamily)
MATITSGLLIRHYRGEPSAYAVRFRRGRRIAAGRGLAFWFRPLSTSIAEVPVDDRDVEFLIRARSADFQDVAVSGVVTYRASDAETLATRVDCSIDLATGVWRATPLEQLAGLVTQLAQQHAAAYLQRTPLGRVLVEGVEEVRRLVAAGLVADEQLRSIGLEIVAVRVAAVRSSAEVEKAMQTPTREQIQQAADEATFARRALAVEKERAIAENELSTQVELARRTEELVRKEGANDRRRATERAAAERIAADAAAETALLDARTRAEAVRTQAAAEAMRLAAVEGERVKQEQARVEVYGSHGDSAVLALVLGDALRHLPSIGQLNLTPDMLSSVISRLAASGTSEEAQLAALSTRIVHGASPRAAGEKPEV